MDWGTIITAAITVVASTGFATLVVYLIEIRPRRRQAEAVADKAAAEALKTGAEAKKTIAEADNLSLEGAFRLIGVLEKQMGCMEEEHSMLKRRVGRLEELLKAAYQRIEYLMLGIRKLVQQIRDHEQEPCWEPDEWDPEVN